MRYRLLITALAFCMTGFGQISGITAANNGLTKSGSTVGMGGTWVRNTIISRAIRDQNLTWKVGDSVTIPLSTIPVQGWVQAYEDTTDNTITYTTLGRSPYFPELSLIHYNYATLKNSLLQFGSGATAADSKFLLGTNEAAGASQLSYGIESWSNRDEVNLFITDNAHAHDISRVNLGCDSAIQYPYFELYVVDPTTYSGGAGHGVQRIMATDTGGVQLVYKGEDGGYVYADQTLRSNLTVGSELTFNKPAIGDVLTIYSNGRLNLGVVPSYADDAAAAGAGLVTGDVYKTTTGGSTFLKILP